MKTATIQGAYRACEETTRREAANFFYGIRLLPPDKRRAMSAAYAFARRVDDIGDGTMPDDAKLAALARERDGIAHLRSGVLNGHTDNTLIALADARERFDLPLDAFDQLVDGVELDVRGTTYETFDELRHYCICVAGSIGRLCVAIFGSTDRERAMDLAEQLGIAMQLTNILRDVREDLANGRIYIPGEDLRRFGLDDPVSGDPAAIQQLVRFEAQRNREWFARGMALTALLDGRSTACLLAMTGIYRRILSRIEQDPLAVTRGRISLSGWEKARVAASSLARSAA
ncbi:phytoene/squalene synthase family protein [Capillimicrobium parvum]|uniref:Phytoene synthase n=1 Tax=Capillimicrobium parvum TaxID=2884022 RepID=A0A9E7C628_9ACTN|nr:squalene/phytoene synthase family protein [Capillimicrobium parvum]UGS38774.1 Phytoene synthase [Capillimicrobium parvum]